jgi:hypothetical protein
LREYVRMIQILSDNRDLKNEIEEAEKMLTEVKLENMPFYSVGLEKGMEKGMAKGEAAILVRLLERRFGPLTGDDRQRIERASSAQLETWADRVLTAETVKEVLAD